MTSREERQLPLICIMARSVIIMEGQPSTYVECDPGTAPKTVKGQALLDLDVLLYY